MLLITSDLAGDASLHGGGADLIKGECKASMGINREKTAGSYLGFEVWKNIFNPQFFCKKIQLHVHFWGEWRGVGMRLLKPT